MYASSQTHLDFGALSCLPIGALVVDARDEVVFANGAAQTLLRRPQSDLLGTRAAHLDLTRQDGTPVALMSLGSARGEPCTARRGDGTRALIELDAGPWCDRRGSVLGTVALLRETNGEREESFRNFIERAPDPITVVRQGRVLYINPAALSLLGYTLAEVEGRPVDDFIHPAELSVVRERIRAVESGQAPPLRENLFVGRDQRMLRIETASVAMPYDGEPAVVSIGRDVTAQRKVEADRERLLAEVEAQRAMFKALFDEAPAGIAVLTGPALRFEMVNPAFRSFAPGYELQGQRFVDVAPQMTELVPMLERVLATGEAAHAHAMALKIRRSPDAEPETAYFTFSFARVDSPIGRHVALIGVVIEATDEVRARSLAERHAETARRRASELSTILETITDAVFVSDRSGALTLVNGSGLRLLGVTNLDQASALLMERPALSRMRFMDGRPLTAETTPLSRALAGETVYLAGATVTRSDGTQTIVRANAAPIRAADGSVGGAVEVAHDVTDLEELDRAKDQFVRVAAHELKTPVAVMKGYAQALLREGDGLGKSRRAMLEAIDRGADRLDRTIRKLLDISQLNLGRLAVTVERVDIEPLMRSLVDRIASPKHVINIAVDAPTICCADRDRLDYVLASLLDNAIRYSPGADRVDVSIKGNDREVITSISDYGCGIPRNRQAHVFERFYRAHTDTPHDFGGLGVELYLCREVILCMGGRIWFDSEEGRGSTFHVALAKGSCDDG